MAQYCFRCENCGHTMELTRAVGDIRLPSCSACLRSTVRDYRLEFKTQQHFIPSHMSARNTTSKSDFLPSEKDFETPADPEGRKGMKEWRDTHTLKSYTELI